MDTTKILNWRVRVYDAQDKELASWLIEGRTEREASKEAMHEVERQYVGLDWTMTTELEINS